MIKNKFFSAEELMPGVWQITNIFDSHARMDTFCYLIEGSERAMLIDTMFGYGDLRAFCRSITDLPVILVNTHYHGDHAGGNFDFDECYLHALDIPFLRATVQAYEADPTAFRAKRYEQLKNAALPENKEMVKPDDCSMPHPMYMWPIWGGDVFDLGGKHIEIIHVGGHTAGEIVLLDREDRICITGDACNSNTLLNLPGSISVEEYLEFLRAWKLRQGEFDYCYGGHESFDPTIIDEGIATCEKVLQGQDEHWESESFSGRKCYYASERVMNPETGKPCAANGQRFNIAYIENLQKKAHEPQKL